MNIFSPLQVKTTYINGLPEVLIFNVPLSFIVYVIIFLSIILIILRIEKERIKTLFLIFWFSLSITYIIQSGQQVFLEYKELGGKSLEDLRVITVTAHWG